MEIPILNIYYLLSYAWDKLDEAEPKAVGQIDNKNVINLFSKVLANRTSYLISRGSDRGYIEFNDVTGVVKGKINISETYLNNLLPMGKIDCTYDELSHNVIHNQILKSTLRTLLNEKDLDKDIREQLKLSFMKLPAEIENIDVRKDHFRALKFHRNNFFYDFLMKICELLMENLLVDESNGEKVFQDFTRNEKQMANLFESFVTTFYSKHRSEHGFRVQPQKKVEWFGNPLDDESADYLPIMKPDIVLGNEKRKIVLDTKYYKQALKENWNKKTISSANIYQMFSYMRNLEAQNSEYKGCDGILLYPTVDPTFKGAAWELHGHKLYVKFINMNQDWKLIHDDLIAIIKT